MKTVAELKKDLMATTNQEERNAFWNAVNEDYFQPKRVDVGHRITPEEKATLITLSNELYRAEKAAKGQGPGTSPTPMTPTPAAVMPKVPEPVATMTKSKEQKDLEQTDAVIAAGVAAWNAQFSGLSCYQEQVRQSQARESLLKALEEEEPMEPVQEDAPLDAETEAIIRAGVEAYNREAMQETRHYRA